MHIILGAEATQDLKRLVRFCVQEVLEASAREARKWTSRFDDARRIPEMLQEVARRIDPDRVPDIVSGYDENGQDPD